MACLIVMESNSLVVSIIVATIVDSSRLFAVMASDITATTHQPPLQFFEFLEVLLEHVNFVRTCVGYGFFTFARLDSCHLSFISDRSIEWKFIKSAWELWYFLQRDTLSHGQLIRIQKWMVLQM